MADGVTFPTFFDGMIVYNSATGTTRTDGNRSSTATDVVPGLYIYFNHDGAANGHVTDGYWVRIGNNAGGGIIMPITSIAITGDDEVNTGESISLSADILPTNATSRMLLWTVSNGTGSAVIDALDGRLTGISAGIVYVYASALDGSGVQDVHEVRVNPVAVSTITIQGSSSVSAGASITLTAEITPANATNKGVTWSVSNGTGQANIDATSGFLLGIAAGTVTVRATATDGSGAFAEKIITVEATNIPVSTITISGATSVNVGSQITFTANILPTTASNKGVNWSVANGTGSATITAGGVLTGGTAGTVTVTAIAQDGSGVSNTYPVTVTTVPVTAISINGSSSVNIGSSATYTASITPSNATNKSVTWSITSGGSYATINSSTGVLTGTAVGTVTVRATAQDGSNVYATKSVTIAPISVTGISISGSSSVKVGSSATYTASITPGNATNKSVTWSIISGGSYATINSSTGVLTGTAVGTVTVRATAQDGSNVYGTRSVSIVSPVPSGFTYTITNGVYVQKTVGYLADLAQDSYAAVVKTYFTATGGTLYLQNTDAVASYGTTWYDAVSICSTAGGRLPTLYELAQLQSNYSSYGLASYSYKSSTEYTSTNVWHWSFYDNMAFWNGKSNQSTYVRCVWSQ